MDLLAHERSRNWESRGECKKENRENLIKEWQKRWDRYEGWAKIFVKDVERWQKSGPDMNYHLTQAFTGHGVFGSYLKKIGKIETDLCWFGCCDPDTPRHTIFECARFDRVRMQMERKIGIAISEGNIAELLLTDKLIRDAITEYLNNIMRTKEDEEKRRRE